MTQNELRQKARRIMQNHLVDDPSANYTELAENAAILLNHDKWLDDPDHWIWDLAIEEEEEKEEEEGDRT